MRQDKSVKDAIMKCGQFRQRGVTLVELMIALAIGLLIVLVITGAYMSGIGAQRAQTDMTRLEESARFGFDLLSRAIRRSGYRDVTSAYPVGYIGNRPQEFCGTDPTGSAIRATNDAATVDLGGGVTANVVNNSDTITVRYYGQDNPAHTAADGVVLDCLGNAVRRGTLVQDTIYVAADPANNNEPTLFCSTDNPAGAGNLALIPGVETMQLLYSEDTDGDTVANRYVPANKLTAIDDARGILVSLIVRTTGATGSDRSAKTMRHFGADYDEVAAGDAAGGAFIGAADGRIRLQFSNFISLRNFPVCK
jgi:type IV pilus assembly protein PilW